ncbi:SGNH/GDSL hydrolase family protein [Mongoliimonas terrestris]|uniref:SGNH/GDSL hydrolase family protein n=1 Tax=Mongoliimonas terrestris TaxID=1709001 RepID=UPI0009497D78|nr:GDSL-type esterase/lipase family protein [Mongoliimonas terrestris]
MFRRILSSALLACLVWVVLALAVPAPASAQIFERSPFFLRLFGIEERKRPAPGPKIMQVPPSSRAPSGPMVLTPEGSRPRGPKVIRAPEPAIAVKPKNADARLVLVLGDALAAGLASGLDVAFADTPDVRFESISEPEAGLAATDPVDVRQALEARLTAADPPDAVVVMLGLDDRRPILVDGIDAEFRTRPWETVYRARVKALIAAARAKSIPVFWVGLVPTADVALITDFAYLDELFRQEAEANAAVYVDVWNAFADAAGGFTPTGADVEGQSRQLRLKDGIGFTKSGNRKLAFFVEQEVRTWLSKGAPGFVLPRADGSGGLVVSLSDPDVEPDEDFAVEVAQPAPKTGTALHRLVVEGRPLAPRLGRVDDLVSTVN